MSSPAGPAGPEAVARPDPTPGGVVRTFTLATGAVRPLLADRELHSRWDQPSVLAHMSVRGLAGHLLRALLTVESYLDGDPPAPAEAHPLSAGAYFLAVLGDDDVDSPLHRAIRERGEEAAAGGPARLLADWDASCARLARRLPTEPAGRLVSAASGVVLRLDDYLATRLVEVCLHADDLAVSLGRPGPDLPPAATAVAVGVLVDMARLRHGDVAVLRGLARRERDAVGACQVM